MTPDSIIKAHYLLSQKRSLLDLMEKEPDLADQSAKYFGEDHTPDYGSALNELAEIYKAKRNEQIQHSINQIDASLRELGVTI